VTRNSRVEQLHGALEAGELHHGVGNLPHPQGHETLVESGHALVLVHEGKCLAQCADEARGGLDLDLCSMETTEIYLPALLLRSHIIDFPANFSI
jgi:hypothetical protein